jgi:hypothetical protein
MLCRQSGRCTLAVVDAAILAVLALVGSLVLALWRHMDGRFNRMEERFDRLDDKVVGHGERIAHMEGVQAASRAQATGPAPAARPSGAVPAEA